VLKHFAPLARRRNDLRPGLRGTGWLRQNIEQHAWDGEWYRRAYFDNGEPLGSATNPNAD
jgi:cellobiose phosphorylase